MYFIAPCGAITSIFRPPSGKKKSCATREKNLFSPSCKIYYFLPAGHKVHFIVPCGAKKSAFFHNTIFQAGMNLDFFHAFKAGQKSPLFSQWGVVGPKQSLGSRNEGDNVRYISTIIFTP